jgi:hypothetical protein
METRSKPRKEDALHTSGTSPTIPPEDLIPIEELARRLHTTIEWVREKCRRRCPNPIPVYNLGRHLLFSWTQVSEFIRNSPRPVHAAHRRRAGKQIEKDKLAGRGIHIAKTAA